MKKITFFIVFLAIQQFIFAQTNQYADFIKTWNFIKYYHPDLASRKMDADSLFLMNVEKVNAKENFNDVIKLVTQNLNTRFSTPPIVEAQKDVLSVNQNFDWFRKNKKISPENKSLLDNIYRNRFDYTLLPKGKSVEDEKKYEFPKEENLPLKYRLLTMAKIRGTVDYLFPHKYLMDKNFDSYFNTLLDEAVKSTTRKDFEIVLAKTVSQFQDSHAFAFYRQLNYKNEILFNVSYYSPFDFQIVGDHLLVTHLISPEICSKAHLKKGDKITEINGKKVSEMIKEKGKLLSVSNHQKLQYVLSTYEYNLIWPDNLPKKTLTVHSGSKRFSTEIDLVNPTDKSQVSVISNYINNKNSKIKNRNLINKDIAYFKTDATMHFMENVDDDKLDAKMDSILEDASHKKAIVFDMRGYPDWGGFIFYYVYKYFSPVENYFYKYYEPNLKNLGTFSLRDPKYNYPEIKDKTTHPYPGKVFILVNPDTRSASEWYSMSLQKIFPKSVTIGQQTSGADGDVVKINLPGDYLLEFTGNGIFYPDNTQTQQKGIRINELVKYTDQDILDGRDLEFERVLKSLISL
ncbi:C-terminal processing protease CtpA/Prc, contains a PDZ domain [Chryseobacterium taichungense]|uniref:C-terminal processing protease CtpA/Prc, contains a PDZ domain n=1 Tax=Chryseobacterium taichungense TaxID=295069 RepID=A0A1H7VPF2_9FLAO|nr:S41 family peptidase [Chryseobacterium taichungense]SEM10759.1 C-terminal processing protease CtpA/Prc, contains a PDZ domain [Chryseobacterium taichungense]